MSGAPAAPGAESSIVTPGSTGLTRRVNGERLVILGWGRAVLLQFAHPLVAAGVADYRGFRSSPREKVARFRRTLRAMLQLTIRPDAPAGPTPAAARTRLLKDTRRSASTRGTHAHRVPARSPP